MSRNTFGPLNQASFILHGEYLRDFDSGETDLAKSKALKESWEEATGEDLGEFVDRLSTYIRLRRCQYVDKHLIGTFEFDRITEAVGFCIATHLKMKDLREWMREAGNARSFVSDVNLIRGDIKRHQREIQELNEVKTGWFMSLFSDNERDLAHLESLIERENGYLVNQTEFHKPFLDVIKGMEAQILDRIEAVKAGKLVKTEQKDWKNSFFD